MKSERIIEAALFSAAKPVTVTDLKNASGLDARTIRTALKNLMDEYNGSERAIEIAKMAAFLSRNLLRIAIQPSRKLNARISRLAPRSMGMNLSSAGRSALKAMMVWSKVLNPGRSIQ